jgi:hypothetical protein
MPYISPSGLTHVPRPKPRFGDSARRAAGRIKNAGGPRVRGAKARVNATVGNAYSKPAARGKRGRGLPRDGTYGKKTNEQKSSLRDGRVGLTYAGVLGGSIGLYGGAAAGSAGYSKDQKRHVANTKEMRSNTRKLKQIEKGFRVPSRPHLITDVGTAHGRAEEKLYSNRKLHAKVGLAAAAGGGAGGFALGRNAVKDQRRRIAMQEKKIAGQRERLGKSAFGVEHEISKSAVDPTTGKSPSLGRRALASTPYASVAHPFVAGKKGKKLRAAGNQIGGGIGLGTAAGIAAGVATRGRSKGAVTAASMGGAFGGQQLGLNRNQRKGYLKPQ